MEVNTHHLIFEKRNANRDPVMGRLRRLAGMAILTNLYDHRTLHNNMQSGIPFPDRQVSRELIMAMPPREIAQPRDYQLQFAIDFLLQRDQVLTAEHLQEQQLYVMRTPLPYEVQ